MKYPSATAMYFLRAEKLVASVFEKSLSLLQSSHTRKYYFVWNFNYPSFMWFWFCIPIFNHFWENWILVKLTLLAKQKKWRKVGKALYQSSGKYFFREIAHKRFSRLCWLERHITFSTEEVNNKNATFCLFCALLHCIFYFAVKCKTASFSNILV